MVPLILITVVQQILNSKLAKYCIVRKMRCCSKENDLFEEIYGKFAEDYAVLVEEHTQTLLKIEENKKHRTRNLIAISLFCVLISMSFTTLVVPVFL